MSRISTAAKTVACGVSLAIAGASMATAVSFGTLTVSHGGKAQGKGKGSLTFVGVSSVRLKSKLADLRKDGTKTYAEGRFYNGSDAGSIQSGRRSDGEDEFASMKTRTVGVAGTRGYYGHVKVCQDVRLQKDWCSKYSKYGDL